MTAPAVALPAVTSKVLRIGALAALGCGVLAARTALLASSREPATVLALIFGALLVVGITTRLPDPTPAPSKVRTPGLVALTILVGVAAFGAGRVLIGGHTPTAFTLSAVAANSLAAVAEEVWFRRLCYGLLEPAGPACAIAGTSVLFAAVHISTYGVAILPLDLAAGALLGWQRATTGSWTAPALTHTLANLFVLL